MFRSAGFQKPFRLSVDPSKIIKEPEGTAKPILPKQGTWDNSTKPATPPQAKAPRSHGASIPAPKIRGQPGASQNPLQLGVTGRFWILA